MRTLLIAANWKMHIPPEGCCTSESPYRSRPDVDVWVFPSFLDLHSLQAHGLVVGGQCGRPEDHGAFTGDVSMQMLAGQRYHAVLCGHSDRREFHGETDEFVAGQVKAALELGLTPIVCVGENAEERKAKKTEEVLRRQLKQVEMSDGVIIAYEPVWAISRGNGNTPAASADDADAVHAFIRSLLPPPLQGTVRILYGGSMKASNAAQLLSKQNIDGGLVGNASLDPAEFGAIVAAAAALRKA